MARFLDSPEFINASEEANRKIDVRVSIDWFDDGNLETIESASDEFIKLDLDRTLEGDIGTSIMDRGTLVLDNSKDDYSPKSIASRFNEDLGDQLYEFNVIPNRTIIVELSVNGTDYYPYYYGIISNIESNYDNSQVSIDIEDEMMILQNEPARNQFFLEESVKNVIETLLKDSAIDFNTELVDDIDYIINYNFDGNTIFEALRLIAEMSWAKFFVTDGELHFIDIQNLDEPNMSIVDTLEDVDFLQSGYSETYGAEDLYSKATVTANPYKRAERDMIWTGAENEAQVSETYIGSDIDTNDVLQLTYSTEEVETKNTNNVPIAEGSVAVEFGNTIYTFGEGITSVDYLTGAITFANTTEYPLPDDAQQVRVSYTFYLLSLPPAQGGEPYEKEIIAKHEFPSIDVSDPRDYVKFEAVDSSKTYEVGSYSTSFNDLEYDDGGGSGDVVQWSNSITLDSDAVNIRIAGDFDHSAYDHRFCLIGCFGGKRANPSSKVELFVNGSLHSTIYQTDKFGWSAFNKKITAGVTGGDEIQLKLTLNRNCDKSSGIQIRNVNVSVGTVSVDQETGTVGRVEVEPIYMDENKTKLIFRNYGDTSVVMYSEYEGKEIDNIYLTGIPFKQNSPIEKVTDNQNAARSFTLNSNQLSIDNNLIYDASRAQRTADFLVDYYSTPKSIISIPIKGRPQYELLDKLHIVRDEADIDNDFLINEISDSFTEEGEWEQTLTLRQARSSQWVYTDNGGANIVERVPIDTNAPQGRPPSVSNLSLSITPLNTDTGSYPSIKVSYTGNRFSRLYNIYLQRGAGGDWEQLTRVTEEEYIIKSIFDRGTYNVKVVAESDSGIKENFASAPVETINYIGAQPISSGDITLTELSRKIQKGLYVPVIEVKVDSYLDEYFDTIKIYTRHEDETEWQLSATTSDLVYKVLAPNLGTYELKVIPTDKHGNTPDFSSINTIIFEVTGNTDLPSQVELESVYWGADYVEFNWKPHPDEDFDEYELRKDDDFGTF